MHVLMYFNNSNVARVHHEPSYHHLHMPLPELYIAAGGSRTTLHNSSNITAGSTLFSFSTTSCNVTTTNVALAVPSQQKLMNATATTSTSSSGINTVAGVVTSIVRVAVDRVLQQCSLHDAIRRGSASGFGIRRKKSVYDEHVSFCLTPEKRMLWK